MVFLSYLISMNRCFLLSLVTDIYDLNGSDSFFLRSKCFIPIYLTIHHDQSSVQQYYTESDYEYKFLDSLSKNS